MQPVAACKLPPVIPGGGSGRECETGSRSVCRYHVPLICLVGASNELPESEELDALYDRFLFRKQARRGTAAPLRPPRPLGLLLSFGPRPWGSDSQPRDVLRPRPCCKLCLSCAQVSQVSTAGLNQLLAAMGAAEGDEVAAARGSGEASTAPLRDEEFETIRYAAGSDTSLAGVLGLVSLLLLARRPSACCRPHEDTFSQPLTSASAAPAAAAAMAHCLCLTASRRLEARRRVSVPPEVLDLLSGVRDFLQGKMEPPVYVSDRRLVKAINMLKVKGLGGLLLLL